MSHAFVLIQRAIGLVLDLTWCRLPCVLVVDPHSPKCCSSLWSHTLTAWPPSTYHHHVPLQDIWVLRCRSPWSSKSSWLSASAPCVPPLISWNGSVQMVPPQWLGVLRCPKAPSPTLAMAIPMSPSIESAHISKSVCWFSNVLLNRRDGALISNHQFLLKVTIVPILRIPQFRCDSPFSHVPFN